ncbi:MAG: Gfo/Idh/MocA family oxidoreductase [Oscillospiraceae bacterium]|nr:Gfo/Idh/MocA family oxidoreductase [Oscillospiraceae bacterium]
MGKKLRFAVIGAGMIANAAHLPAMGNLCKKGSIEVAAIADDRLEAAQETAKRFDIPAVYTDAQKMLDEISPDFVAVCTPNMSHKKWAMAALKAGAHVMCEKPLTLGYKDAAELFGLTKSCGKLLLPCQSYRWGSDMQFASDALQQCDLGSVYHADINLVRRFGIPTWGFFHMKDYNGGGPFCDLGVHLLDSLLWLLGNPRVESVSGMAFDHIAKQGNDVLLSIAESGAAIGVFTPRPYDHREFDVEELSMGFMRLEGGIGVNFRFTWALHYPSSRHFMLFGEKGGLNVTERKFYNNTGHYQSETALTYYDNRPYAGIGFNIHWHMYDHILDVLEGREESFLVRPEQTLNIVSAIECYYRSAAEGREVRAGELEGYPG